MSNDTTYHNEDNFSFADEAPLLAQLKGLPEGFVCPDDYESKLTAHILLKIHRADAFDVPSGYFKDQTEHTLAFIVMESDQEDFIVPDGYFQSNSELLDGLIQLQHTKQDEGYVVPENYFDQNTDRVVKVAQQQVPNNYFEELPEQIIERVQPKNRVITMKRIATWSVSFAAAAAIALLLLPKNPVVTYPKSNTIVADVSGDTLLRAEVPGVRKAKVVTPNNVIAAAASEHSLKNEDVLNVVDVYVLEDVFIEQMPIEEHTEIMDVLLNESDFGQLNDTKQ